MGKLLKPLQMQGFLNGWTATVSGTVSNAVSATTTRHYCPKTAETSPQLAFTSAVETGLFSRFEQSSYENKVHPVST